MIREQIISELREAITECENSDRARAIFRTYSNNSDNFDLNVIVLSCPRLPKASLDAIQDVIDREMLRLCEAHRA